MKHLIQAGVIFCPCGSATRYTRTSHIPRWCESVLDTEAALHLRTLSRRSVAYDLQPGDMALVEHTANGLVSCHVVAATHQATAYQVVRTEGNAWKYDMASGPMARATFVPTAACVVIAPYIGVRMEKLRAMRCILPPHVVRLISLWRVGLANRGALAHGVDVAEIDSCIVCRASADLSRDDAMESAVSGTPIDRVTKCVVCLLPSHSMCMRSVLAKVTTSKKLQPEVDLLATTRIRYPTCLLHTSVVGEVEDSSGDTFVTCALCELLHTEVGEEVLAP